MHHPSGVHNLPYLKLGKMKILHLPIMYSKGQYINNSLCQEREMLGLKIELG
jgi:hypothetical protein